MLAYLFIECLIILFGLMTYHKTRKEWAILLSFALLLFFAGLRGDFTSDYNSYADYFFNIRNHVSLERILNPTSGFSMEKGFVLLCKLIGFFTRSEVVLFTVLACLTLWAYFRIFRKLSVMPVLSILLFVSVGDYFAGYNLTRQILAASLAFLALTYWYEKKPIPAILLLVAAYFNHQTSLIVLPALFFLNMKINRRNLLLSCGIGAVAFLTLPSLIRYAQTLFPVYQNYVYGMDAGTVNAVIPQLGMLLFILFSIYTGSCDFDPDDRMNRFLFNSALLATLMLILGTRVYIVSRLSYYFKPAFWVLIPKVIQGYRTEQTRRIILVAICLFAVCFTWITLSGTGYDPYYFFFQ